MKLKSEETPIVNEKPSLANNYRTIIESRLMFIEESLQVIKDAFSHLNEDSDEVND